MSVANGIVYLMTAIQHRCGESDLSKYLDGAEADDVSDEVTASNINSKGVDVKRW